LGLRAVPALVKELGRSTLSDDQLHTIGLEGPVARELVKPLADHLSDANLEMRQIAAETLARYGPVAAPAREQLVALLEDKDHRLRLWAAVAVMRIDPKEEKARSALRESLGSAFVERRLEAWKALPRLGPAALVFLPEFKGNLGHPNSLVRTQAALAA